MSHVNQSVQNISRQKEGRKSNKAFMILSALGIIFVVDVHLGQPLAILTNIFPYDSFFMPMFAFNPAISLRNCIAKPGRMFSAIAFQKCENYFSRIWDGLFFTIV